MGKDDLEIDYESNLPLYIRLLNNLKEAIANFLEKEKIQFLTVNGRVKEYESFSEKFDLKKYTDPFIETEDLVGIRIIVYYPSDLQKVQKIIENEFQVLKSENKQDKLDIKEFGYRSLHFVVRVKDTWLASPNYRGLEDLKAEIQIRTILMHAWAEIEHKLQYKNNSQIPAELKRKLFRLSAKFEEADEQFQEIKERIQSYAKEIKKITNLDIFIQEKIDMNLDSFSQLLTLLYPNRETHNRMTRDLFNDVISSKLTFPELIETSNKFAQIEKLKLDNLLGEPTTSANTLRYALDCFSNKFKYSGKYSDSRMKFISKILTN